MISTTLARTTPPTVTEGLWMWVSGSSIPAELASSTLSAVLKSSIVNRLISVGVD